MNELINFNSPSLFDGVDATSVEVTCFDGTVPTVIRKESVAKIPMELSRAVLGLHDLEVSCETIRKSVVYPLAKELIDAGFNEAWLATGLGEDHDALVTIKVNGSRKEKDVYEFNADYAKTISFKDALLNTGMIPDDASLYDVYHMIEAMSSVVKHVDGVEGTPTIMFPNKTVQQIKEVK